MFNHVDDCYMYFNYSFTFTSEWMQEICKNLINQTPIKSDKDICREWDEGYTLFYSQEHGFKSVLMDDACCDLDTVTIERTKTDLISIQFIHHSIHWSMASKQSS